MTTPTNLSSGQGSSSTTLNFYPSSSSQPPVVEASSDLTGLPQETENFKQFCDILFLGSNEKEIIFPVYSKIPTENRENFQKFGRSLILKIETWIGDGLEYESKAAIIKRLSDISPEEWSRWASYDKLLSDLAPNPIKSTLAKKYYNSVVGAWLTMVETIAKIPESERNDFSECFRDFRLEEDHLCSYSATIMEYVARVPHAERKSFQKCCEKLGVMTISAPFDRQTYIYTLASLTLEVRVCIEDFFVKLKSQSAASFYQIKAIKSLIENDVENIQKITNCAVALDLKIDNTFDRLSAIENLAKIPASEIEGFEEDFLLLFPLDMSSQIYKSSMIEALGSMKRVERKEFVDLVKKLITPEMNGIGVAHEVWQLNKINPSQRATYVEQHSPKADDQP